ncbi:hypothetical protein ACFWY5_12505 [Nonomuraea sp. NPDC059007]|uniref:hypothetical protein n=1 Tax=Nonomuraea sp. NPDC059007 TaxID=3346692 RepID=UPI0036B3E775
MPPEPTPPPTGVPVIIPPNSAGWMLALCMGEDGSTKEALVKRHDYVEGFRGGLTEREKWLPLLGLQPIPGEDYTTVPWQSVEQPAGDGPDADRPPGWPTEVAPPTTPSWQDSAVAWMFEALPPDYRAHQALRDNPRALAAAAAEHLDQGVLAARKGFSRAAVDLRDWLPPHAIEAVLDVYRTEGPRLVGMQRGLLLVTKALRDQDLL